MASIEFYVAEDASSPFEEWFADLDPAAAAKITVAIGRLEQGYTSNIRPVGEGVAEYRVDWGPGYRIYFGQEGTRLIILLTGGTKKRQQRDIAMAQALWKDYKRRSRP